MGKKQKRRRIDSKNIKNTLPVIFSVLLLAVFVLAVAPTIPTIITPTNNTAFLNATLTCSGSTDGDGDDINYLLWYKWNSTNSILLQNSSTINYNYFNFAPLGNWEFTNTTPGNCNPSYVEGTSSYLMQCIGGASGKVLNLSNTYRFNADYWPVYIWGDAGNKNIYIDGYLVYNEGAGLSTNHLAIVNVTNFTDGSSHDIIFNFNADYNEQMYFWFEHTNATIMCQSYDDTGDFSNNLTYQYIMPIFKGCNASNPNIGLDITFENENNTGTKINGTLNNLNILLDAGIYDSGQLYSYQGTNSNEFEFCITPDSVNIDTLGTISYSFSGYPTRTVFLDTILRGDTEYPLILYLLPTNDGIYVTFQVIDVANAPISGVTVTASKILGGSLKEVSSGMTDSSGLVTFWLDPNSQHTITASKAGYNTFSEEITPTQSAYTITLGGVDIVNQSSTFFGINYTILPTNIILNNDTVYDFTFDLDSSYYNLSSFGFTLYNSTDIIDSTSSSSVDGGTLVISYNTGNNTNIGMNYWWVIGGNYTNLTTSWDVTNTYEGGLSLKNFFDDLAAYAGVGFGAGYNSFASIIISIIIIVGVTAGLSYAFGIYSPLGIMSLVFALIFTLEYIDFLPPLVRKYVLTSIMGIILVGYFIEERSR